MLYSRLSVAIALSLLLHLLLLALLLLQRAPAQVKNTRKTAPLTIQIVHWPKPKAPAPANGSNKNTEAQPTSTTTTAATKLKTKHTTETAAGKKPPVATDQHTTKTVTAFTAPKTNKARKQNTQQNTQQNTEQTQPQPGTTETATLPPSLADRILATVATRQQQQATELSSAEVKALQQKTLPEKALAVTRSGPKPAYAAANVLEVMKDGSFIEKIGDYCYQAKDGADLRRDISSMKPVSCGDDANAALYQSIMDKVGSNRQ